MADVLIRNVPDGVIDVFKRRAAAAGVSVTQALRDALVAGAQRSPIETFLAAAREAEADLGPNAARGHRAVDLIRQDRDR